MTDKNESKSDQYWFDDDISESVGGSADEISDQDPGSDSVSRPEAEREERKEAFPGGDEDGGWGSGEVRDSEAETGTRNESTSSGTDSDSGRTENADAIFCNGWDSADEPEPEAEKKQLQETVAVPVPVSAGVGEDVFSNGGWGKSDDKSGSADIVFLIDVTGSMTPCIDALKRSIKTFLSELVRGSDKIEPTQNWRVRIVGYRDYPYDHDKSYGWICDHCFTREPDLVVQNIDELKARGGGLSLNGENDPESLLDAVQYVLDAGEMADMEQQNDKRWRSHAIASRVLVVFTDAPFHDKMSIPEHAGEDFDVLANRLIDFYMHGFMFVPNIPQYEDTFSELPHFVITQCGEGADGLAGTMSDPEKLRHILLTLQKGISKSASNYP